MARRKTDTGMGVAGGAVLAFGIILFVMTFLLVGVFPFQLTQQEQGILYLVSFVFFFSGLALFITR
jgi:hypothetical protein